MQGVPRPPQWVQGACGCQKVLIPSRVKTLSRTIEKSRQELPILLSQATAHFKQVCDTGKANT